MENESEAGASSCEVSHGKYGLSPNALRTQVSWDGDRLMCVGGTGSPKTMGNARANLTECLGGRFPQTLKTAKVVMSFQEEKL